MTPIAIKDLDGNTLSASFRGEGGVTISNIGMWIDEVIAREFGADPDEITTIETDCGEFIGVGGKPVAFVEV